MSCSGMSSAAARYSAYQLCCRRSSSVTRQAVAAFARRASNRRFCSFFGNVEETLDDDYPVIGQPLERANVLERTISVRELPTLIAAALGGGWERPRKFPTA
jgi:hypothetical protein